MKTTDDKDVVNSVEKSNGLSESNFNDRSASANQTVPSGMAGVANAAVSAISSVVSAAFCAVTNVFSKKRGRSEEHLEGAASIPKRSNPQIYIEEDKPSEYRNESKRFRLDATARDKKRNAGSTTAESSEKSNDMQPSYDQPAVAKSTESSNESVHHPNQNESRTFNEFELFGYPEPSTSSESEHVSNIGSTTSVPSASINEHVVLPLPVRSSHTNSSSETPHTIHSGGDGEGNRNDDDNDEVSEPRESNAEESINLDRFIERFRMLHIFDRHTPAASPSFAKPASISAGLFSKIETETDLKNEFSGIFFNPPQESQGERNLASDFGQLFTASPPLNVANEIPDPNPNLDPNLDLNPNPNPNLHQSNVVNDSKTDVSSIPTTTSPVSHSNANEVSNLSSTTDAKPSPLNASNDLGTNANQSNVAIDAKIDASSIPKIASSSDSPSNTNEVSNLSSESDEKSSNYVIQTPEPPNTSVSEQSETDSPSPTADSSSLASYSTNEFTNKNPMDSRTPLASNYGATSSENKTSSYDIECDLLRSKGNEFFKCGNYDDAMQCYNEAVSFIKMKMQIGNQDISSFYKPASLCYCNRAAVKIHLEMYGSALADCQTALTLNPEYTKAKCRAAKCLLMFGLAENAIALANESVNELSKKDDEQLAHEIIREAKDAMSVIQCKDQTYTEALESMERLLFTYPLSVQATGMKARLLIKLGKFEEAKNFWQKTRTTIVEALLPFNQTEKLSLPSSFSTPSLSSTFLFCSSFLSRLPCLFQVWQRIIHGRVLFAEGDIERALGVLKDADKECVTLQENGVIDSFFIEKSFDLQAYISDLEKLKGFKMEGNKAFQAKKMEDAVRSYDSALAMPAIGESRTYCAVIFCNRAAARMHMECYANAMDDCSCAIALQPFYEKALLRRIEISRKVRDFDRAISDLQTLIRLGEEKERRRRTPYPNPADEADLNRKKQLLESLMESDREGIPPQHYLILGLDPNESSSRCKTLYLKLAIKHHPDKAYNFLSDYDRNTLGDVAVRLRKEKEHFFKLIQNASSILSDPQTRQNFDAEENARNDKKRGFESTNSNNDFDYQHQNQQHNFNNNNYNNNQYSSNFGFGFGFGFGSGSNGVPPNEPPHQPPPAQRRRQSNPSDFNNNPNYNPYNQYNNYSNQNQNNYYNQNFNGYYYGGSNAQGHGTSHNSNAQ